MYQSKQVVSSEVREFIGRYFSALEMDLVQAKAEIAGVVVKFVLKNA
jgi:hypothetical protein